MNQNRPRKYNTDVTAVCVHIAEVGITQSLSKFSVKIDVYISKCVPSLNLTPEVN